MTDLDLLKIRAQKEIQQNKDLKGLDDIYKRYLGKKGEIAEIFKSLKNLSEKERKKQGELANRLKGELIFLIENKRKKLLRTTDYGLQSADYFDITAPGRKIETGHLHPLTLVRRKIQEIFQSMGFSIVEDREVEDEWHNFDALNVPKEHPAREMHDTIWLQSIQKVSQNIDILKSRNKSQRLLLRTHTSPVQIRYMQDNNPPLRIIAPGRVFRYEATDVGHEINFYQVEGLMVDKNVSVANFKAIIQEFFKKFFTKEVEIRLRPSYFPFVEPGFEIDISCVVCHGKGCSVCSKTGWIEMMGAGMVHPNVFKAVGYNPKSWQGFAFGIGMDRLAMMKYKIDDIRLFYGGDLRFLNQF